MNAGMRCGVRGLALRGSECECCACGERFSRERAFDRHRHGPPGDRHCHSTAWMVEHGWQRNARGCWVSDPLSAAGKASLRRAHVGGRATPAGVSARPENATSRRRASPSAGADLEAFIEGEGRAA